MHFITLMTSYFDVTSLDFDIRNLDVDPIKGFVRNLGQMNIDAVIKLKPNVGNSKGV